MRTARRRAPLWGLAGASLLLASGSPAQDRCSRLAVSGVRPGMTVDEVRAVAGSEGNPTQLVLPDGRRASVEEYALPEGTLHVEYDGMANRGETRVALVRQPLRQDFHTVTALVKRLGEPVSGSDALVQGLQYGPAVWVDPMCDLVLTYYRRNESWFQEEVTTFLRVESLSKLPEESPASAAVQAFLDSGAPPPPPLPPPQPDEAQSDTALSSRAEPPVDTALEVPPRRTEYYRPSYPAGARQLGVKGAVTLRLAVQRNGKVADAKVVKAEPEGYGFEEAALEAAHRWKFIPASRNGLPVDGEVEIVVRFR